MIGEWPKRRFEPGSMTDEEANRLVVPADLAQKQHSTLAFLLTRAIVSSHGLCGANDPDGCEECAKRWSKVRAVLTQYEKEVISE